MQTYSVSRWAAATNASVFQGRWNARLARRSFAGRCYGLVGGLRLVFRRFVPVGFGAFGLLALKAFLFLLFFCAGAVTALLLIIGLERHVCSDSQVPPDRIRRHVRTTACRSVGRKHRWQQMDGARNSVADVLRHTRAAGATSRVASEARCQQIGVIKRRQSRGVERGTNRRNPAPLGRRVNAKS